LPAIWAKEQGIETLEVSSAVELTEDEKKKLRRRWLKWRKAGQVDLFS